MLRTKIAFEELLGQLLAWHAGAKTEEELQEYLSNYIRQNFVVSMYEKMQEASSVEDYTEIAKQLIEDHFKMLEFEQETEQRRLNREFSLVDNRQSTADFEVEFDAPAATREAETSGRPFFDPMHFYDRTNHLTQMLSFGLLTLPRVIVILSIGLVAGLIVSSETGWWQDLSAENPNTGRQSENSTDNSIDTPQDQANPAQSPDPATTSDNQAQSSSLGTVAEELGTGNSRDSEQSLSEPQESLITQNTDSQKQSPEVENTPDSASVQVEENENASNLDPSATAGNATDSEPQEERWRPGLKKETEQQQPEDSGSFLDRVFGDAGNEAAPTKDSSTEEATLLEILALLDANNPSGAVERLESNAERFSDSQKSLIQMEIQASGDPNARMECWDQLLGRDATELLHDLMAANLILRARSNERSKILAQAKTIDKAPSHFIKWIEAFQTTNKNIVEELTAQKQANAFDESVLLEDIFLGTAQYVQGDKQNALGLMKQAYTELEELQSASKDVCVAMLVDRNRSNIMNSLQFSIGRLEAAD
ncbi:MAG: hypothetical protein AAF483_00645 [Planctomycetota bacterium]